MSESYDRGRIFEMKIQRLTRRVLKIDIKRDKQSGAGTHKQDLRAPYGLLPIHIECKDQKTLKPKEWWREADAKSSFGQAPIVVFPDNEEILCVMRYSDLLNFIKESHDWQQTAENLRNPLEKPNLARNFFVKKQARDIKWSKENTVVNSENIFEDKTGHLHYQRACRAGHIADINGYCQTKNCIYRRGYKPKKAKAIR